MKIGILTGGGDAPGINPCIKMIVSQSSDAGHEVIGILRGWQGLLAFNQDDPDSYARNIINLDDIKVRTIDRTGGTFLHTSRTNPAAVPAMSLADISRPADSEGEILDLTTLVLDNLDYLGIDLLVAIGGDETLSFAERLYKEGFPVIAVPKTIDNDVNGTDYCIGFSTAVTLSVHLIHRLRYSSGSHERVAVVELFGKRCGETCLVASYLAGVDRALIPEVPFDLERLAAFVQHDRGLNPSNYVMLTISDGAREVNSELAPESIGDEIPEGASRIGEIVAKKLKRIVGVDYLYQRLAYLMRSGAPDALDLMVAKNFANLTVSLINQGLKGRMVALRDGLYTDLPLDILSEKPKRVDVAELYDEKAYRPRIKTITNKPMFLY